MPHAPARLPLFVLIATGTIALLGFYAWHNKGDVPPPYEGAPYYSASFAREMREQPGSWYTPPTTHIRLPNNFKGRWFNTNNGARITLGQPAEAQNTIWLLGGAAVYNGEVPDAFTVASQLQNLLNKQGNAWKVENAGVPEATSAQELERLKILPIKKGDIVLFLDGATDAMLPLPPEKITSNMGNALLEAARYSNSHGAGFAHVLQPVLFAQPQLSDYEKTIPVQPAMVNAYTQLRQALPQLAAHSGWAYADLSELLNGPDEYYLTCCTSNERGGALIAGYLRDFLFAFPQPQK